MNDVSIWVHRNGGLYIMSLKALATKVMDSSFVIWEVCDEKTAFHLQCSSRYVAWKSCKSTHHCVAGIVMAIKDCYIAMLMYEAVL